MKSQIINKLQNQPVINNPSHSFVISYLLFRISGQMKIAAKALTANPIPNTLHPTLYNNHEVTS